MNGNRWFFKSIINSRATIGGCGCTNTCRCGDVTSINTQKGDITITGAGGITVSNFGPAFVISNTGSLGYEWSEHAAIYDVNFAQQDMYGIVSFNDVDAKFVSSSNIVGIGNDVLGGNVGSNIIAFGLSAGYNNAGNNCTFIGNNSNQLVSNTFNNRFIAYSTNATRPFMYGDTSDNKLSIGTSNLSANLTVSGSLFATRAIYDSTYSTGNAGQVLTTTGNSTAWASPENIGANPIGNTLRVDACFGVDATALTNPYTFPFKTITAALNYAGSASPYPPGANSFVNVIVNAGTYNEKVVMPTNVSLTGEAPQAVIIQQLGVTASTTLVTMGSNSRVENFTGLLSSPCNVQLVGVDFPSNTSANAKLRVAIMTITSTSTASANIYGIQASGISDLSYSSVNAIQRTSINVISSSTAKTRGIYVGGPNRFAVRDIVVYARGSGADIIGVETDHSNAIFEGKTSTFGGSNLANPSGFFHDINRTQGTMIIGSTDLLNNDPYCNSFTPGQAPSTFQFGINGGNVNNRRCYLVPGTQKASSIDTTALTVYDPSLAFNIPSNQRKAIISLTTVFNGTFTTNQSLTLNVYKNNISTAPVLTSTLSGTTVTSFISNKSAVFNTGDTISVGLDVSGNIASVSYTAILGYY